MVPFESLGTVSYSHSIVTMRQSEILVKNCDFFIPNLHPTPSLGYRVFPSEYCHKVLYGVAIRRWKKFEDMFFACWHNTQTTSLHHCKRRCKAKTTLLTIKRTQAKKENKKIRSARHSKGSRPGIGQSRNRCRAFYSLLEENRTTFGDRLTHRPTAWRRWKRYLLYHIIS